MLNRISVAQRLWILVLIPSVILPLAYLQSGSTTNVQLVYAIGFVVLSLLLAWPIYISIIRPLREVNLVIQEMTQGSTGLAAQLPETGPGELAQLGRNLNELLGNVSQELNQLGEYRDQLINKTDAMMAISQEGSARLVEHQDEANQVAAALQQLSASVQEIAGSASDSASAVDAVRQNALAGHEAVEGNLSATNELAESISLASGALTQLGSDVEGIGGILEVIRSVAEQTNLLALNAAIEAARAGEQGRGFAVVADEVRSLAQRTQKSTDEIQQMTEKLQGQTARVIQGVQGDKVLSARSVELAKVVDQKLQSIINEVVNVTNMSAQIAVATEEQDATVKALTESMSSYNGVLNEAVNEAEVLAESGQELTTLAQSLKG